MLDAPQIEIHWQDASVIDGDTIDVGGIRYRIENIDAPEIRGRCKAERMLARLAASHLAEVMLSGTFEDADTTITVTPSGKDQYGRTLARLSVRGVDIGETMVGEGYAVRWEGRRASWCAHD